MDRSRGVRINPHLADQSATYQNNPRGCRIDLTWPLDQASWFGEFQIKMLDQSNIVEIQNEKYFDDEDYLTVGDTKSRVHDLARPL